MADLPHLAGVDFRMFRGKADYPDFARIITASARGEGDDRVETPEALASAYDHLERCDPSRDLLVAEVDGRPVGYSRVWWDPEAGRPAGLQTGVLPRSGVRRSRDRRCAPRLERGSTARDRVRPRRAREGLRSVGGQPQRGRDRADRRRRVRARHVHGRDGQTLGRRSSRPCASRGRRDPAGPRGRPARDLGGRHGCLPRPLGLRRADGGGIRALPRVPVQRPLALEDRVGRRRVSPAR